MFGVLQGIVDLSWFRAVGKNHVSKCKRVPCPVRTAPFECKKMLGYSSWLGGQPTFAAATMNVCSAETSVSAIRFWARVSMKTYTLRVWRQLGWHFAKAVFPAKLLANKNYPHERQHESGDQFIDHRKAGKHRAFFMVSAPVRRRLVVSKISLCSTFSRSGHRVWSVRSQAHRHPCFLRWFRTSA